MKTKFATVKYANSLPFQYGLELFSQEKDLEWMVDTPSGCSDLFKNNEVDIALLPVGAVAEWDNLYLASDYCIGCDGSVGTVVLLSDYPKDEIKQIVFDPSSKTSNLLVQIIVRDYWKRFGIKFVQMEEMDDELPAAYVFIGDEVFEKANQYKFKIDLGEQWKEWTGLPFVFAVWVSKKKLSDEFKMGLDRCFSEGIKLIPALIKQQQQFDENQLKYYFEHQISFHLDDKKMEAIDRFLSYLGGRNPFISPSN